MPARHAQTPAENDLLITLAREICSRADEPWPLATMAAEFSLSPSAFQRRFTAVIGLSPKVLQDAARLGRLKSALKAGSTVTDAILEAGFGSTSRVYGKAPRDLGMTLSAYRDGAPGETIHWAARRTRLGWLAMAATARGVCFAQFGEDAASLRAELAREFPKATVVASAAHAPLDAWIDALDAHLSRSAPAPDLPLDLRGTAFQMRVWRFLRGIPLGETRSYADVARAIGAPKATRAVGTACGANRVAVLVPCHRVLRGDGALGGYRWGLERKRALLSAETAG
ncbi:methylated-DNA--[protein]-cysteine S-methyltransferase [Silanimonas sp.]|jgi:AraC family transcriptional regulator of adaptative response/methylated-DNA-[protein]-cysteine methyltransferase|uniref:methylated-DNA--[protein]-cysteine S-methyltransferase n=1 Tax=Silanimonas sp. TaxID=1929290 RepID=UPI0022C89961|nr:methylated-DNA--[protein]-cysteine S-methyltransferase [Silanimonas sp.]MCZ8114574.1 methylated-DNA--[protein]-cysteine S-methyltransferase [Silanimonas sp.]